MIRKFQERDIDRVMEIWLNTNIETHKFIPSNYWKENFNLVKELIPQAEVYLYEIDNGVVAFAGVVENYIAGIFVTHDYQSQGIGREILNYLKEIYPQLTLQVYEKNFRAFDFYMKAGFKVLSEDLDSSTGEREFLMGWGK